MKTRIHVVPLLAIAACVAAFIVWNELTARAEARRQLAIHAQLLAAPLWNMDRLTPLAYLDQAITNGDYARVEITTSEGAAFIARDGPPPRSSADRALAALGLIPTVVMSAPIRQEQVVIGSIAVHVRLVTIYADLYACLVGGLLIAVAHLYMQLARTNRELNQRVAERTADLESQIRVRAAAEASAREARSRLLALIGISPVAISCADPSGAIVLCNDCFQRMFGWRTEEIPTVEAWFARAYPDPAYRSEVVAEWQRRVASAGGGGVSPMEVTLACRDGSSKLVAISAAIADGQIIAVFNDLTEVRRWERELRELNAQLEQRVRDRTVELEAANRAKSDFLARMSHEIRTPLNAVLGYAQVLARDAGLAPAHRQAVQVINRSGEHLLQLINDILEMSRIEAGRGTCEADDFDVHALFDNLRSLFLQRASDKGLQLVVTVAPEVPRFVRTDQRKLRQMMINLLANAVKFTRVGQVSLAVSYADGKLACAVTDTGPGMTTEEVAHLGQPFVQAEAGRRRGDGTGLGLAITRAFASLLGGELVVHSVPGQGSTFEVVVAAPAADGAVVAPAAVHVNGLAAGQRPPRLLIAEDHAESRELLRLLLLTAGCSVEAVSDGAAAVAACRGGRFDLVWMDIDMPVMDGLAATAAIRALPGTPPLIVALTAAAFADDRQRFLAGGCCEVMNKPFQEEPLFRLMERLLGVRFSWSSDGPAAEAAISEAELVKRLAAQPASMLAALSQAVVVGDMQAGAAALAGCSDVELAAHLRELLAGFHLPRIEALLAATRGDAARRPAASDRATPEPASG